MSWSAITPSGVPGSVSIRAGRFAIACVQLGSETAGESRIRKRDSRVWGFSIVDNRDVLIGVLASALIGTLILWWQTEKREPSGPQESDRAPTELPAREAPVPRAPATYDRSAGRPTPSWSPDLAPEGGMPVHPEQAESFRFRPLGERERQRLERQTPYTSAPWSPRDRTETAPAFGAQPMQPTEPWNIWRQGYGGGGTGAGPRSFGGDTRDPWQGPAPPLYRHVPQPRASPPDRVPPSQRMYPSLDQPTDGPPADRPLIGRRTPGDGAVSRIPRSAGSASPRGGIRATPEAVLLDATAGRLEKEGRICDA